MATKLLVKTISSLIFTLLLFAGLVVGIGGYFGFVPYANKLFGSDKPRDLGMRYSPADSLKVQNKIGVKLVALPKDTPVTESIKLKGKKNANYSLTGEEITALANNRPWKYYPLSDVQIKINQDGSIEASGMLDTAKLISYAQAIGFDLSKPREYMNKYHLNFEKMPFYVKGTGSVTEGKLNLDIQKVETGRLSIPQEIVDQAEAPVISFVETYMSKAPGFYAKKIEITSSKFVFDGSVPEEEATVNN